MNLQGRSSCFSSGTRRVTLVTNTMIDHEWGKTGLCHYDKQKQIDTLSKQIHDRSLSWFDTARYHLWHGFSVTINHVMSANITLSAIIEPQLVPIGVSIVCWKTRPPNITNMRKSKSRVVWWYQLQTTFW
jgi:hypothetical protein